MTAPGSGPQSSEQLDATQRALALVALAERGDSDAFALALTDAVAGPEDAGRVVYGLVGLVRFTLAMSTPDLAPAERVELLEALTLDTATLAQ